MMTPYEILSLVVSGLALLVSIGAWIKSASTASATIELAINERITSTVDTVSEMSRHMTPLLAKEVLTDEEERQLAIYRKLFDTAIESNLNAYEEACAKYLDRKVDKRRFKKTYRTAIRQLVENEALEERFNPLTTRYKAIVKVYEEWENLER